MAARAGAAHVPQRAADALTELTASSRIYSSSSAAEEGALQPQPCHLWAAGILRMDAAGTGVANMGWCFAPLRRLSEDQAHDRRLALASKA